MIHSFNGVLNIENTYAFHSLSDIKNWIHERKEQQHVAINMISLDQCNPWFYDRQTGQIRNERGSFFQISGLVSRSLNGETIEQPIIIQKEIGFLGIICTKIHGVWHFLMQAKIEPGNINYVQISPTLQATKSNFSRQHGGKEPLYLEYFLHMKQEDILVDQIQSEQSSRFLGKRNRNVIIKSDQYIEETSSHKWMTLWQLRELMKCDNLINMDTRTVLSCMPFVFADEEITGYSSEFKKSVEQINKRSLVDLYLCINNYKMFSMPINTLVPLTNLTNWYMTETGIKHKVGYPFEIIYCNLQIEGREVTTWNQPLFAALGQAVFGLICNDENGVIEVLVQIKPEVGCFDGVELGPSVQEEYGFQGQRNSVTERFFQKLNRKEGIMIDVVLSEEGGRFYHEQNRNVIMLMKKDEVSFDPEKYVWTSVGILNSLTQINNCLNIQLRNLMMLLSMYSLSNGVD